MKIPCFNLFKSYSLVVVLLIFTFCACSENSSSAGTGDPPKDTTSTNNKGKIPTVMTVSVSNITTVSAAANGKVMSDGGRNITERGICWGTAENPSIEDANYVKATSVKGSGAFKAIVDNLQDEVTYHVRAYAQNKEGTGYGENKTFTTLSADKPKIEINPGYASGTTVAFISAKVASNGGYNVIGRGFCWSKGNESNPTLSNAEKRSFDKGIGSFFGKITELDSDSRYNVRAYAINNKDTAYSNPIEVQTIVKGEVTYSLHKESNPSDELQENYSRIENAFDEAVSYMNTFTSITKHIDVSYSPGTPTADGNINGHINMGPKPSYQQAGTALHEIAHTVGVGTTGKWGSLVSSEGIYQGPYATKMLQFMTQDSTAELHGDSQHFWPYGINGANEDTGKDMLYIIHCLIVQGMKKDGLPSN